jgi:endonuclease
VKRFLIAIPTAAGGVELSPMKEWLRQHPDQVPDGMNATQSTSHELRRGLKRLGWGVQETDTDVRLVRPGDASRTDEIAAVLGLGEQDDSIDGQAGPDPSAVDQAFRLEYQLRDFLAENLPTLLIGGRRLRLYVDVAGRDGIEYPTAVGPIDILAEGEDGAVYVFELKRASAPDRAVGQLTRYMGWVKATLARGRDVRGVIVAKRIDERLRYAASVIPGVLLLEYAVEFRLSEATPIADDSQSATR